MAKIQCSDYENLSERWRPPDNWVGNRRPKHATYRRYNRAMQSRRSFVGGLFALPLVSTLPTDPADLTIGEAAALIRRRKLTPLELTEACVKRVEKLNSRLNAFITVLSNEALAQAKLLKLSSAAKQALHGIPIALKDLYDTAGIRTTAASAQWRDRVPDKDAVVVQRLRAAGAVFLGKANLDEFAYNFTSETSAFGASHNPWNTELSPGGSSGGSAIAVASGMSLGALGSDTGGSIRLPAAFCGVTGFKPTYAEFPPMARHPRVVPGPCWANDAYR